MNAAFNIKNVDVAGSLHMGCSCTLAQAHTVLHSSICRSMNQKPFNRIFLLIFNRLHSCTNKFLKGPNFQ